MKLRTSTPLDDNPRPQRAGRGSRSQLSVDGMMAEKPARVIPRRTDRTRMWVALPTRASVGVSAALTQPSTSRLSRYPPSNESFHWQRAITVHAMAGAKETRNRSESREQDDVCTQLSPSPHTYPPAQPKQNFNSSDEEQGTGAAKPGRKKNPKCDHISSLF